ncbi:hypothetical protein SAMN05216266_101569 [Amycolatopsis marina]|uniref:Anti-sigma-M factor RsmA n=1 Tax=Amycolatopsis marina TaxID=490629 RepID=A0A1I0VWZ8_9PSEU|nr:hypothetical protein [Amycolatopsis marina]SFA80965.1 hypothetical protein SAMN05216266_101569 [Amycolatopsis marina]
MTDESRGIGGTVGPPWSVDLLADLHGGVLDDAEANRLWPQVNADPEARAVLDALDSTVADLGALPMEPVAPMPPEVAARIDAALTAEVSRTGQSAQPGESGVAPVVSLDAARRKRNRMLGWGGGLLTAAAAAVAAVAIIVPNGSQPDGGQPAAAPPTDGASSTPPLSLRSEGGLGPALGEISGVRDFGPLGDQQRLDVCLEAAGIDPDVKPAGVRPVTLDGREAVLVLYPTGELAQFRMVAFAPDCGPGNPELLLDKTVGKGAGG